MLAESRTEFTGLLPPEWHQILQLPEETHLQSVVPKSCQPVAVQQHSQQWTVVDVRQFAIVHSRPAADD